MMQRSSLGQVRCKKAYWGLLLAATACSSDDGASNSSAGSTAGTGAASAGTALGTGSAATSGTGSTDTAGGAAATGTAAVGSTSSTAGTGSASSGGTTATSTGTGGSVSTGTSTFANPFNCAFAWGAPYDYANSNPNSSYLDFVSVWIGDETNGGLTSWSASATNSGAENQDACGDCAAAGDVADTNAILVFYTYFIGFQACALGGYCDCNNDTDGSTLCTGGAQWIRNNRAVLVNMYGQYAKAVYAKSPNKPVIWWLEGDFIQYSYSTQSNPLSMAELGSLTRDFVSAIKTNQPNAIVGMNHSPWISDGLAESFWTAMPKDVLDLAWVQAAGTTDSFPNSDEWNTATATLSWLHSYTGLPIMAETSYQGTTTAGVYYPASNDLWTSTTAFNLNARIDSGVIGTLINTPQWSNSSTFQSATSAFSSLDSTCN